MEEAVESCGKSRDFLGPKDALTRRVGQVYDPTMLAFRPQRVSLESSKCSVLWDLSDYNSESLPSPTSSHASFTPITSVHSSLPVGSAHFGSQRSSYATQQMLRSTAPPPPVFQRLPPEIYDCILQQLKEFHYAPSSMSCQTCYLRDLCSLSLTSRAWDRSVRKWLYDCIYLVGHDSPWQTRKSKVKSGVRLKLLRRTLRERRVLAQYVHQLKVPRLQADDELVGEDMLDIVASIVMACPNLEVLVGFQLVYSHKFDRLTHALSTRRKLKEHTWIIGENSDISLRCNTQLAPGLMDAEQVDSFLHFHDAWASLTTLFLQSHRQGILERDVFIKVLNYLPSLQHLCISQFDMDDFDDIALQALPPLQSLRLQDLEGVTFWGLLDFARGFHAQGIRSLSLINLNITYISVLSNLLLNLKNLRRFKLIQDRSPMVEPGDLVFQPIVASPLLEFIHWDIVRPGSANENLANSIRANGFPNLRVLRAPSDHDGLLQAVCRPRAQILLPSDKYRQAQVPGIAQGQVISVRMLSGARKAAQERIEEARKSVQFKLSVEEEGVVHQIYDFNGFIGTIGSKITYNLEPDVLGSDASLVDFGDLAGGNKEVSLKDSCTGMWNASHHGGKRWWSHVERHRYQPLDLQKFF